MEWFPICEKLEPYVVRIETQDGHGTGFLFGYNEDKNILAIATAAHVVGNAERWHLPIKFVHQGSGKELFTEFGARHIMFDWKRDSASIILKSGKLPFPTTTFPLIEADKQLRRGVELAWLGYPGVAYPELCFFRGAVSSFLGADDSYLVDGVAINGVSGGPVFTSTTEGKEEVPHLVGIVSAYISNNVGSRTLPGLSKVHDISPFYKTLKTFKDLDDARKHAAAQAPAPPDENSGTVPAGPGGARP